MEVSKQILLTGFLVATCLHCLQGMSIHSRQTVVQPITENCSDTVLVESLIKAYAENDNATSHRFFHGLLPMFDQQYNIKTVGDLLALLEEGNNSTLEISATHSIPIEQVASLPVKDTNTTSNIYAPRGMRSIENVRSSFKSPKKKSLKVHSSKHDVTVGSRVNNTADNRTSVDASLKTSEPLNLPMDGITLSDENSDRLIDTKSEYLMKTTKKQIQSGTEMYGLPQAPSSRYVKSHSGPIQSSMNLNVDSSKNLSSSLKPVESPMICSPKAIIDILRKSLSPSIMNNSSEDSSNGSSNKFVLESLTLEEHPVHPAQEVDDSVKNSTRLAVMKISSRNLDTDSIRDLLPLRPPDKENIIAPPIKKNKNKHKQSKTSASSSPEDQPTSKKVKNSRHKDMRANMPLSDKSTKITDSETIPSVLPVEVNPPGGSSKAIADTLRRRDDPAMFHVYENMINARGKSLPPYPTTTEHLSGSPFDTKQATHVYLDDNFTKDNPRYLSHSSSVSHRETIVHGKFKGNPLPEPPARNISSMNLIDESFTKSLSPSKTRVVKNGFHSKPVTENVRDNDEILNNANTKSHFEDESGEPNSDFVNREAHANVAEYTHNDSFPFYQDDGSLETPQDVDMEPLQGKHSFLSSTENEDTLRDARDENSTESAAITSPHKTTHGDDAPLRITLPQTVEESSVCKISTSAPKHNKNTHSQGDSSDEYSQESWQDSVEEVICDDQSEDVYDDWTSSCINEPSRFDDVGAPSTPQDEGLDHPHPLDTTRTALDLRYHNDNEDGLNVSRRHTDAKYVYPQETQYSTRPSYCPPYLPWSYYWQHHQHPWPPASYGPYVNYNVPPFYCPQCPRSCSDPPPQPRPRACLPCPQLFCSPQFPPSYPTPPPNLYKPPPRPKCPPCPKSCSEPCPPRPPGCKKCPSLNCPPVCPPCPKLCVVVGYRTRPVGCAPCPIVPNCANCPHCGSCIDIPDVYVCPVCHDPIFFIDSRKSTECRKSSHTK